MLQNVYKYVLTICINSADERIPKVNTGKNEEQQLPGWNYYVVDYHQEVLYWHYWWKVEGRPHQGHTSEMRRITRASYHRVLKMVKKDHDSVRKENMVEAVYNNNSRDLFAEVKKMSVCVGDVVNAVKHLKSGKSSGEEGLNSDHLTNAPH